MTVSKRTRFEVLRRDDYTCRYCRSNENPITIDHVLPVTLGGTDTPDNLVAACRDCNSGKSSGAPDASMVAGVEEDALRWSRAMEAAANLAHADRETRRMRGEWFRYEWDSWKKGPEPGRICDLPPDWEDAISRQFDAGLDIEDIEYAVNITMAKTWVTEEFRYFMGVCRMLVTNRIAVAKTLIENGDV